MFSNKVQEITRNPENCRYNSDICERTGKSNIALKALLQEIQKCMK